MIRVCPERDAACPHGEDCPYADTSSRCKYGWSSKPRRPADSPAATVKALEWRGQETTWAADSIFGTWRIVRSMDGHSLYLNGNPHGAFVPFASLDEAKAAARAHEEQCRRALRAALSHRQVAEGAVPGEVEPVALDFMSLAERLVKVNAGREVIVREGDGATFVHRDVAIEAMQALYSATAVAAEHAARVKAEAELARLTEVREGWQPIETAPRDGTTVDLYGTRNGAERRFLNAAWVEKRAWGTGQPLGVFHWTFDSKDIYGEFDLTHWRPLPAPPASPQQGR